MTREFIGGEVISVAKREDGNAFIRLEGFVDGFLVDETVIDPGDHIHWFTDKPREVFLSPAGIDVMVGLERLDK
jgi:hypothetical protein